MSHLASSSQDLWEGERAPVKIRHEADIRKKLAKEFRDLHHHTTFTFCPACINSLDRFSRTESDFPTLKEYNDYLEEYETIGKSL